MRRLRVLVSAYACHPYRGSEDGVGWGWLRTIAERHDVHVITADFQREPIERWCTEHPGDAAAITFHHVPRRWFHYRPTRGWRFVESTVLKPLMNLAYAQWLRDAARLARALDAEHDYHLVHLVTYVGYRFPGRYDALGKPLVWGPIGGLENTRWRFLPALGVGGALYYAGRNVVNSLQRRWLPSPRRVVLAVVGAIERLTRDEDLRRRLAAGALVRAARYTWRAKGAAIEAVYVRACPGGPEAGVEEAAASARAVGTW